MLVKSSTIEAPSEVACEAGSLLPGTNVSLGRETVIFSAVLDLRTAHAAKTDERRILTIDRIDRLVGWPDK